MTDTKKDYYISIYALIISLALILIIIGFIGFVIYCLFLVDLTNVMIGCIIICLVMLLIFVEAISNLYRYSILYFKNLPALRLTKDELIDNINNQSYSWEDIKSISIASVEVKTRINVIAISLINPDKYLQNIRNPYKKLNARFNEKYFRGAFSIQPNLIKCKNDKLFEDLTQYFEKQRSLKSSSHSELDNNLIKENY